VAEQFADGLVSEEERRLACEEGVSAVDLLLGKS
jgi:hypothetical protein